MMREYFDSGTVIKTITAYSFAILLCGIITVLTLKLWLADLNVPLIYHWDALDAGALIKGMIDNGWVWENSYLGMPFGNAKYDFPWIDSFNLLFIKLISLFTHSYGLTWNVWYLLTFPLTTVIALFVFRQFKISYPYAILGSLLYTFVPYHFFRQIHLSLFPYFFVPLVVMVVLWITLERPIFFQYDEEKKRELFVLFNVPTLLSIIVCFLISGSDTYYAFFACYFLFISGITVSIKKERIYPVITSFFLICIIISGVVVSGLPSIIFHQEFGKNPIVAARHPAESENYGLKITQLLMPIEGHRISSFAKFSANYSETAPLVNENRFVSLGIFGSIGFLSLIIWIFYRISKNSIPSTNEKVLIFNQLGILSLSAIFLSTIGGFNSFLAYSFNIFAMFRSYNRISIFLAFFSIFAFILVLRFLLEHFSDRKNYQIVCLGVIGLVLFMGIMDQTSNDYIPMFIQSDQGYSQIIHEYYNDKNFVNRIENILPSNAMIFQLPYVPYPENPPVQKMGDYDLFKGYLHSDHLRWSYGAMKGREGAIWQEAVAEQSPESMMHILSCSGFSGIYIDSYGYSDEGKNLISAFSETLGQKPIISNNSRLYFFDIRGYNDRISGERLNCSYVLYLNGWFPPENRYGIQSRWMTDNATILIHTNKGESGVLYLEAKSFCQPRDFVIMQNDKEILNLTSPPSFISIKVPLTLEQRDTVVQLRSPEGCERPLDHPELKNSDTRCLSFTVQNVSFVPT